MTMVPGPRRLTLVTVVCNLLCFSVACSRQEAPQLQPAAAPAPRPAPPPPPVVRDAAADVVDAASDASDARSPGHARRPAAPSTGGSGGNGGLKVEGALSRADADKVVRSAHSTLRSCFETANPPGSGRKGKVSFKLTVDDRGHVTVTEIPLSTLPGGSEVETCMVHALRDLRFPRSSGQSVLSFQMTFAR